MNGQFCFQFELGDPAQILSQDGSFDFQLMLVAAVLVLTASAAAEVRASRLDPMRRRLQDLFCSATVKAAFLFEQRGFDFFAFENKGHKHRFAAAVLIGGQPCQPITAVNEFFNSEEQEEIVDYRS